MEADTRRSLMLLPPDALMAQMPADGLEKTGLTSEALAQGIGQLRLDDPLISLQPDSLGGDTGGQFTMMKLAPNFEMAMYLAQATGACIVTDSPHRWAEVAGAVLRRGANLNGGLPGLAGQMDQAQFGFADNEFDVVRLAMNHAFAPYPALLHDAFKYLGARDQRGAKPNFEAQLAARFSRAHGPAQSAAVKLATSLSPARLRAAFPAQGIQDNTVNRLLLMSSSEHHLASVPMAFYIAKPKPPPARAGQ